MIGRCLRQVFNQRGELSIEVLVLDCESSDQTVKIAQSFETTVFSVCPEEFSYARSLNFGISQARGRFFVSLSAHAIPCDEWWLHNLVCALVTDETLGASFSCQRPFPEASMPEAKAVLSAFPDKARILRWNQIQNEPPLQKYHAAIFSNVSSCIRTDLVRSLPFRELPFSEDRYFAIECLQAGHGICYAATSKVFHLHPPSRRESQVVSERAMIAQGYILFAIDQRRLDCVRARALRLFAASFLKLCSFPVWFTLRAIMARSRREVSFYWAQLGVLIGKMKAAAFLWRRRPEVPAVAGPLSSVKKMQNG